MFRLPFYCTFLILVLSSSVIAKGRLRKYGKTELLIHNKDAFLPKGLWSLVELSAPVTDDTRAGALPSRLHLDQVIQFEGGALGVDKVYRRQIKRKLMSDRDKIFENERNPGAVDTRRGIDTYRVVRTRYGDRNGKNNRPAPTVVEEPILIEDSAPYLDNTYWGRNTKILGEVSDSLMIWKPPYDALYRKVR
jgi:hypothetical protein